MRKSVAVLIQIVIVLISLVAITFMLWEPRLEGRNINASTYAIYFNDPFLAYAYVASIPFFLGLYQIFNLLNYAMQNGTPKQKTVKAFRIIKFSAVSLICFVLIGELMIILGTSDDHAGGVFLGMLIIFVSATTAIIASKFERNMTSRK